MDIKLDSKAEMFQILNVVDKEVEVKFEGSESKINNIVYDTWPMLLLGKGHGKLFINHLGNYAPKVWNLEVGCILCWEDTIDIKNNLETPKVLLADKEVVGLL